MPEIKDCIEELRLRLGERLSTAEAILDHHGHDESWHPTAPPDAVLFAENTEDVVRCAAICTRHKVPMVAFGTGSSMEGNVNAVQGGISIDTSRMNKILARHAADMDCEVEAGVTREELNSHLRDTGLFFPVDPGANASLGGMAATRASGTTTVKYGSMRENVIGLEAVLADGTLFRTGGRARKSSSGSDLLSARGDPLGQGGAGRDRPDCALERSCRRRKLPLRPLDRSRGSKRGRSGRALP